MLALASCGDDDTVGADGTSTGGSTEETTTAPPPGDDSSSGAVDDTSSGGGDDTSTDGGDTSTGGDDTSSGGGDTSTGGGDTSTGTGEASSSSGDTSSSGSTGALPLCGDGLLEVGEDCDDADVVEGDGCDAACMQEPGFDCAGEPSLCAAICGDGMILGGETCDDGDPDDGNGCSATCESEPGWSCMGEPSVCVEIEDAQTVALGGYGGCVLSTIGNVGCFGDNTESEVGNGTDDVETFLPTFALDDAIAIAAGDEHHCAIRTGGSVWCWGDNADGQMGPQSVVGTDEPLPVEVTGLPVASAIAAGDDFNCIIDDMDQVWCWGDNDGRQLGLGGTSTTDSSTPTPVPMPGGLGAIDLGLGQDHACAVLEDDTVACWGDDDNGQLGDGLSGTDSGDAQLVPMLAAVDDVEAGEDHTCAVTNVGELHCWGDNLDGQLGIDSTIDNPNPQPVALPSAPDAISLGDQFSCALLFTDEVLCWGEGADFQLGSRDIVNELLPVPVQGLPAVDLASIEAGGRGVCVTSAVGERYCWGYSEEGQLGIAPLVQPQPAPVSFAGPLSEIVLDPPEYRGVSCGVMLDGTVQCAGAGDLVATSPSSQGYFEPLHHHIADPITLPLLVDVQSMRMGDGFACVATSTDVQCWGDNLSLQLGQGGASTADILTPVAVVGLGAVDELELGDAHACVRVGGTVQCWGENGSLQTGESSSTTDQSLPVTVGGLADAVDLALGEGHGCALRATGTVSCWGEDFNGQLGDDDANTNDSGVPVDVTGLPGAASQIVAGQDHNCALVAGEVYCWGEGGYGNLGQNTETDSDTALLVPGLSEIVQLAAGWNYNCALDGTGNMSCWGYALDGQLGDGGLDATGLSEVLSPVPFAAANAITNVVAGNSLTCIETAGGWGCMGFRTSGQLANGTTIHPAVPTPTYFGP